MARTLEQIDAEIDSLLEQRANPARGTRVGDIGVDFKSDADIAATLASLRRERRIRAGRRRPTRLLVTVDKGY